MILPAATEFAVRPALQTVDLTLERKSTEMTLTFRAAPPKRTTEQEKKSGVGFSREGQYTTSLELPEGLLYEVWHKTSGKKVATGSTRHKDIAPKVILRPGTLYIGESYLLKALPGFGIHGGRCDFVVKPSDHNEVVLQVQRSLVPIKVAFIPFVTHTDHWAAAFKLPPKVPFEIVHKLTQTIIYKGNGGKENRIVLSSEMAQLFTGERYVIRTIASKLLNAAHCEFVASPAGGKENFHEHSNSISYEDEPQEVVLPVERASGDVRLVVKSNDGSTLPMRVPYKVEHKNGHLVVEGQTASIGSEVDCEPWFVNDGALFYGETYNFIVPLGHGFEETKVAFTVGGEGAGIDDDDNMTLSAKASKAGAALLKGAASDRGVAIGLQIVTLPLKRSTPLRSCASSRAKRARRIGRLRHLYLLRWRSMSDLHPTTLMLVGHQLIENPTSKLQEEAHLDQEIRRCSYMRMRSTSSSCKRGRRIIDPSRSYARKLVRSPPIAICSSTASLSRRSSWYAGQRRATLSQKGLRLQVKHADLKAVVAEYTTDESDVEVRCVLPRL